MSNANGLETCLESLLCTLQDNSYTALCILGEKKSLRHGVLIFKDLMPNLSDMSNIYDIRKNVHEFKC